MANGAQLASTGEMVIAKDAEPNDERLEEIKAAGSAETKACPRCEEPVTNAERVAVLNAENEEDWWHPDCRRKQEAGE